MKLSCSPLQCQILQEIRWNLEAQQPFQSCIVAMVTHYKSQIYWFWRHESSSNARSNKFLVCNTEKRVTYILSTVSSIRISNQHPLRKKSLAADPQFPSTPLLHANTLQLHSKSLMQNIKSFLCSHLLKYGEQSTGCNSQEGPWQPKIGMGLRGGINEKALCGPPTGWLQLALWGCTDSLPWKSRFCVSCNRMAS